MALPDWLTVSALKRRVGKELAADDALLGELLEETLEQVQEPAPVGCGRLLIPDPPLEDGEDTAEPVTRQLTTTGRRVVIPDAREITAVECDGDAVSDYTTLSQNGVIVQLELPCTDSRFRDWAGLEPLPRELPGARRVITVTGRFGFLDAPHSLRGAIYILAARAFYEREAQYADTVAVGEGAAASTYFRQLQPRARLALEAFALPPAIGGLS